MFWIATCAAIIAAVVLLREILLPFVAGLVLAYLLIQARNQMTPSRRASIGIIVEPHRGLE